jgi:hypothetical protein
LARPGVRGTFSLSGPSRPTAGSRLAPTLGSTSPCFGHRAFMAYLGAIRLRHHHAFPQAPGRPRLALAIAMARPAVRHLDPSRLASFERRLTRNSEFLPPPWHLASLAVQLPRLVFWHSRLPAVARNSTSHLQCCLTPRSSGAPTAGRQARSAGTPSIFCGPGPASHRRCPLTSNVRPHWHHWWRATILSGTVAPVKTAAISGRIAPVKKKILFGRTLSRWLYMATFAV